MENEIFVEFLVGVTLIYQYNFFLVVRFHRRRLRHSSAPHLHSIVRPSMLPI